MIRIKVGIKEHEHSSVKTEARRLGIPVAEFLRRALQQALRPRGEGRWMRFAGFVETGNPRSSRSIDEVVYGTRPVG